MSEKRIKARKLYLFTTALAMAVYLVVVFVSKRFSSGIDDQAVLTLLALAPLIPLAAALAAFLRYFRFMDERERLLAADAAAISFLIAVFAAIALGFLQSFGAFASDRTLTWFGALLILLWTVIRLRMGGPDC